MSPADYFGRDFELPQGTGPGFGKKVPDRYRPHVHTKRRAPDSVVFPGETWDVEPAESHGMSSALLQQAADEIGAIGGRQGFVVVRDGVIIHETYWYGDEYTHNTAWSVTKSFGSTLVGIAVTQGLLTVDGYVTDWVAEPPYTIHENARVKHLLSQTSESDPPGSAFHYDSEQVVDTLSRIVSAASGMSTEDFAQTYLLEPLSLDAIEWATRQDGTLRFGYGIHASCRDLARLGWLYLNNGMWNGERIVSEQYIYEATHAPFPYASAVYGYLWWLNTPDGDPRKGRGLLIHDAPGNLYMAIGLWNQLIIVVPAYNMVITSMGDTRDVNDVATLIWDAIEPALPTSTIERTPAARSIALGLGMAACVLIGAIVLYREAGCRV